MPVMNTGLELFQERPDNKHSHHPYNSLILLKLPVTVGKLWLLYPQAFASAIRIKTLNPLCAMGPSGTPAKPMVLNNVSKCIK